MCFTFLKIIRSSLSLSLHPPLSHLPGRDSRCCCVRFCVRLCFIHSKFLIIFETHLVVNHLFQPANIIFLRQKMVIFYCKFLLPPLFNLLIFSKQLYSLFTFNSMFYNENNDFIGEQYELVKLKYSVIIFLFSGCMWVCEALPVCVCVGHCNWMSLYWVHVSIHSCWNLHAAPCRSAVTRLSHQH